MDLRPSHEGPSVAGGADAVLANLSIFEVYQNISELSVMVLFTQVPPPHYLTKQTLPSGSIDEQNNRLPTRATQQDHTSTLLEV